MSPEINNDICRNYFLDNSFADLFINQVQKQLEKNGITPIKFPLLIDLFSGNAPVASLLHQLGWQDITAVDLFEPDPMPNFPINWLYGDLFEFSKNWAESSQSVKKSPFIEYFHKFDFLTCFNAIESVDSRIKKIGTTENITPLIDFFLKPGGVYITQDVNFYSLTKKP